MRSEIALFQGKLTKCLWSLFAHNFPCKRKFVFSLLKSSQQHEHVNLVFYNRFQTKSQFHPKFKMMPAETKNFVFLLTLEQSWMDRSRSFSILHLSDWNQSRARVVACHKDHQVEKFNWCKEKNCQQWLNQMQFLIIDFIFDFQPFFERSSGVTLAFLFNICLIGLLMQVLVEISFVVMLKIFSVTNLIKIG